MCETKFDSYMCVHFNATSWHLLEQCVVLPVGNALGQSGTLETCLTLSQQSQYDVFSTGERKNRCMLVFFIICEEDTLNGFQGLEVPACCAAF